MFQSLYFVHFADRLDSGQNGLGFWFLGGLVDTEQSGGRRLSAPPLTSLPGPPLPCSLCSAGCASPSSPPSLPVLREARAGGGGGAFLTTPPGQPARRRPTLMTASASCCFRSLCRRTGPSQACSCLFSPRKRPDRPWPEAQLARVSSRCAKVAGSVPVRAHTRGNQ